MGTVYGKLFNKKETPVVQQIADIVPKEEIKVEQVAKKRMIMRDEPENKEELVKEEDKEEIVDEEKKVHTKLPLNVVITGYGPFMTVTENPSATLLEKIIEGWKTRFGDQEDKIKVLLDKELVVHSDHVDTFIKDAEELISSHKKENPGQRYVLIHLGVSGRLPVDKVALESQCFNAMNFKDGDTYESQYCEPIQKEIEVKTPLSTELPLQACIDSLKETHPCFFFSEDPGHYLCNYIQ